MSSEGSVDDGDVTDDESSGVSGVGYDGIDEDYEDGDKSNGGDVGDSVNVCGVALYTRNEDDPELRLCPVSEKAEFV